MRRLIVGGLAAALLAASPATAPAAPAATALAAAPAPLSTAQREEMRKSFRDGMILGGGELVRWAMAEYPDEFRQMEDEIIDGFQSGRYSTQQLTERAFAFMVKIRARAMAFAEKAPDAEIRVVLQEQVKLLQYFKRVNLKACYEFGENGGLGNDTAGNLGDDSRVHMTDYANFVVKAVIAGKRTPVSRRDLNDVEFQAIFDAFEEREGDMAWLTALNSGDFSNVSPATRCDGAIILLQSVLSLPDPVVGRFMSTN